MPVKCHYEDRHMSFSQPNLNRQRVVLTTFIPVASKVVPPVSTSSTVLVHVLAQQQRLL
jgi:hypothetical protein